MLSVTPVGALVTHLSCDVPLSVVAGMYTPVRWREPLHIRRAEGGVWLDDELSRTPIPAWEYMIASVEAKSPADIWVTRSTGTGPDGYFHWNGSVWEQVPMLTTPAGLDLYAAGLFDWQGTKLIPYLPAPGATYQQGVLPLFGVLDGSPAPSFARMSATEQKCKELQPFDKLRYNFAVLPTGDVFVVEHPCDYDTEETKPRVGHWSNGRVTVARVPGAQLQLTAGRIGSEDTVLLWGTIDDAEPILYRWQRQQWVRVKLPPVITAAKGQHRFVGRVEFDGDGAAWIIFSGHFSIWRYDGHWSEYVPPEVEYQQLTSAMHGDLWSVNSSGQRLYRLRGGHWSELPFFRDEQWAVGVTVRQTSPDDIWIEVFVSKTLQKLIYRNRAMQLLNPCQRQ